MSYAVSTYLLARLLSAYIVFHFLTMSIMNYPLRHFSEFFVLVCFVIISSFVLIFPFADHFIDNEFASSFVVLFTEIYPKDVFPSLSLSLVLFFSSIQYLSPLFNPFLHSFICRSFNFIFFPSLASFFLQSSILSVFNFSLHSSIPSFFTTMNSTHSFSD